MREKIKIAVVVPLIILVFFGNLALARPQNSQTAFKQLLAQLQKKPDDQLLREKIIKIALKLKPTVPQEAYEQVGEAKAFLKNSDWDGAIRSYQKALLLAPWVPGYYNALSDVQEKAGKYDDAITSLKLCLLASPPSSASQESIGEKIGMLRGEKTQAEKEALAKAEQEKEKAQKEQAAREQAEKQAWIDRANAIANQLNSWYKGKTLVDVEVCKKNPNWTACNWGEYQGVNWYKIQDLMIFDGVEFEASPDGKTINLYKIMTQDRWLSNLKVHLGPGRALWESMATPDYVPATQNAQWYAKFVWQDSNRTQSWHLWFFQKSIVITTAPVFYDDPTFDKNWNKAYYMYLLQ